MPRLRDELQLLHGAPSLDGAPTWLLFDPVKFQYFQIDVEIFELLSQWNSSGNIGSLRENCRQMMGRDLDDALLQRVIHFAEVHELFEMRAGGWRGYYTAHLRAKPGWIMWLIHNYLFIRVPLIRQDQWLRQLLPFVTMFYTRRFAWITVAAGTIGLYLVSRQWGAFIATFPNFFSFGGAALYVLTLAFVKSMHELGHAFTAARHKCRVVTMGIAFLVMTPMLYSDVTDAWKLPDRRARMQIDAAGVIVELAIACFATLAWSFLPNGGLRSAAFLLATSSWLATLAINLSPFMRFDGYYMLSDFLGVPNLQPRAFRLGSWRLREALFDVGVQSPERLPQRTQTVMIFYAYAVWLYRAVVYFGIALLVYHYFFKILGIILFFVEVGWFLARPVTSEIKEWWKMRQQIQTHGRAWLTFGGASLILVALIVPWSTEIEIPAVLEPAHFARVYTGKSGEIRSVNLRDGDFVHAGDPLITLESPKLEQDMRVTKTKIALIQAKLDRRVAEARDRADTLPLDMEKRLLRQKIAGLTEEMGRLVIRAPINGQVRDVAPNLRPGIYVEKTLQIAMVADGTQHIALGYVDGGDVERLGDHAKGVFIPDDPLGKGFDVKLQSIARAGTRSLDIAYLASVYGGPLAVRPAKDQSLVPENALFLTKFDVAGTAKGDTFTRGVISARGDAVSYVHRFWEQGVQVFMREAGI